MRSLVTLVCALVCSLGVTAPASGQHVRARLVSEDTSLTPGKTQTLGVLLEIDPGWHVYWLSAGDTGLPLKVSVTKRPEWLSVGELQWPAPRHYLHEGGDLLDFVHDGPLMLLLPITVSADAKAGSTVTLGLEVSWLVCDSDACIPGSAEPTLTLPVDSAPGARSEHAALMDATRARLPKPRPDDLEASWDGLTLVVRAKADAIEAFPHLPVDFPPPDLAKHCASAGPELRLTYSAGAHDAKQVRLLIGLTRNKATTYHWVELSAPPRKKT